MKLPGFTVTASEDWRDYRVDWSADTPTEIEVPGAVGDGEGFLSALMPGDKIALWARAEVGSLNMTCHASGARLIVG